MRSMLTLATPIERASLKARVACAASVLRSSTASARGSKPCTPRLRRLTPPSSQAATRASSVLAGLASRVTSASGRTSNVARMNRSRRVISPGGSRPVVRNHLFDALPHAVLDACDLAADLLDVGVLGPVALALAPQAGVLAAQVRHRSADAAIETQIITRLGAGHLLAAVAAEDEDR